MAKKRLSKIIAASVLVLSSAMVLSSCDLNEFFHQNYENPVASDNKDDEGQGGGGGQQQEVTVASITITNTEALQKEWHVKDVKEQTRTIDATIVLSDGTTANTSDYFTEGLAVATSSNPQVISVSGRVLTPVGAGTATITVKAGQITATVDITVLPEVNNTITLQALREGITNGTIKAKDEVEFEGIITATVEPTTGQNGHVYSGVYVQDGDYAIMLYAGQLSQYYEQLQLKIGDSVHVKGVNSPYGGFNEIKPSEITKEIQGNLAKPTVLTVTGEDYADVEHKLLGKDGNLAKVTNAVYKSGTITVDVAGKVHNTLVFGFPKTDGSLVDVDVFASYHLGTDALNALKAVTDTLKPGDKVNLDGNISVNENKFQFALNFLEGKTPAQCVVPTGESQTLAQPESIKITAADDVKELEVGKKLQLSAEVTPADAVQTVKWSSSDAKIAKVGEDTGLVEGIGQGKVTITATSTVLESVKATFELDVKENNDPYDIVSNPEVGVAYRLGLYQDTLSKPIYANGKEDGNYLATTEDIADGADWYIEDVSKEGDAEKTYKIYTQSGKTKKYINLVDREYTSNGQQKISHDPKLQDESTTIWKFNTEYNTFTTEVGTDGEMYLGTYSKYETLSMSKISYAKTSFVSHFMSIRPKLVKEAPKVDTPYLLGLSQDNLKKNLFFAGEMDKYYYKTTESAQFAKNIYFESATGGYYMYFKGEASAKKYLNYVQTDESHKGVVLADTAVSVWTYNSEHNTMTTVLEGKTYYLGTYSTYNTISASELGKISTSFPTHLFESLKADDSGETPDTPDTPDTPVEDPKTFAELKDGFEVKDWTAVVTYINSKNVYLDDGTAGILAYCNDGAPTGISKGDFVKVSGTVSEYKKALQIGNAEVTKLTEGTPNEPTKATELTQAKAKEYFDAKSTPIGGLVSINGVVMEAEGNYVAFNYGDARIEFIAKSDIGLVEIGKKYNLEGYLQGFDYGCLLFVGTKATKVDVELTSLTCKASADKVKVDEEITLSAEGNPGADVGTVTYQITEGSDKATITGNKLKGVAEGTVKVVAKSGSITSEPITITVEKKEEQGGETPTQVEAVMRYTGTKTANMTGGNDAGLVNLDEKIFTVSSSKNGGSNHAGLNKDGTIRLYSVATSGDGTSISVSLNGGTIDSILVSYKQNAQHAVISNSKNTINGTEEENGTIYTISDSQFSIKNTCTVKKTQIWITSISITYTLN